jgi:hypothetical protein
MSLSDLENEIELEEEEDDMDMMPSPPASPPRPPAPSSSMPTHKPLHTFVNHTVSLLEKIDRWNNDDDVSKSDMARDIRTELLMGMRAAMVHPFTSFYSLEASTVMSMSSRT